VGGKSLFTNYWFVAFATGFFVSYWAVKNAAARRSLLLVFSVIFYWHYAGPSGVMPILLLGIATYFAGAFGGRNIRLAAVAANVGALLFYKYTIFLTEQIFGGILFAAPVAQPTLTIIPPLAISFFVFEFVHYLVDVLHGKLPIRSPMQFALFAMFFPTVVAGPIKRYEEFLPALEMGATKVDLTDVGIGIRRITIGLCKKLLLADFLTGYIDTWQPHFAGLPTWHRWLIFGAITLRILFDFSGYSDIAIGLARMMGIRISENFNWPYLATSVQDFWRRWHISLSTWIRDYVYIPLGGSRQGMPRKLANAVLAFALCGLWHGAAWHFVLWGIYHGVGLVISANYATLLGRPGRILQAGLKYAFPIKWLVTQLFVMVGWLYFFYPVAEANQMLILLTQWTP
jgi:alginate O-acetyltransferase complex protein AlgI